MFRILRQAVRAGVVTEPARDPRDAKLQQLGIERRRRIHARFGRSLAVRNVDAGSCNGRELEVQALNNPFPDLKQFGLQFVASSRHAGALLVTGPVSRRMETALRRTWRATSAPQTAVASGDCACKDGEFGVSYASCGWVENVIPVDVSIPGCPPPLTELTCGLLAALEPKGAAAGQRSRKGHR